MARRALNLILKIAVFCLVMLIVAKSVPYDNLVNDFMRKYISFDRAKKLGMLILGELDPEPYDSIRDYINVLLNILISMPLFSLVITTFNTLTERTNPTVFLKEWSLSTMRRFAKLFAFIFLFWAFFRLLPYQAIFPDTQAYSTLTMVSVIGFNLLITAMLYCYIVKKSRLLHQRMRR